MGDGGGRAEEGRVMVARTHFSDGTYLRLRETIPCAAVDCIPSLLWLPNAPLQRIFSFLTTSDYSTLWRVSKRFSRCLACSLGGLHLQGPQQ